MITKITQYEGSLHEVMDFDRPSIPALTFTCPNCHIAFRLLCDGSFNCGCGTWEMEVRAVMKTLGPIETSPGAYVVPKTIDPPKGGFDEVSLNENH